MGLRTADITRIALLAAVYAALTAMLPHLSYGPFFQFRVSEALTVLPYVMPIAVPALFVGCLIANIAGGLGIYDIVFGSLATLIAAVVTRRMPSPVLAPLPPVVINALIVGFYLSRIAGVNSAITIGYVAFGQILACYGLGYPLLLVLSRRKGLMRLMTGRDNGG